VTYAKPVCFFTPARTVEMASASSAQCVRRPKTIVVYVQVWVMGRVDRLEWASV
jgi:hypothetical protein